MRNDLNFHKSNKFDLNVRFLLLQLFSKHFLVIFQENRRKITEHCPGVVEHRRKSPENLTAWLGLSPKSPENWTAWLGLSQKSPENWTAWPGLSPKSPENLTDWPVGWLWEMYDRLNQPTTARKIWHNTLAGMTWKIAWDLGVHRLPESTQKIAENHWVILITLRTWCKKRKQRRQ